MPSPGCLWNRPRLERLVDGALGPWTGRVAAQHASRCEGCGREVERLRRLRVLIQSAQADVADPDWSGFWSRSEGRRVGNEGRDRGGRDPRREDAAECA